jgi:hypothetical protein
MSILHHLPRAARRMILGVEAVSAPTVTYATPPPQPHSSISAAPGVGLPCSTPLPRVPRPEPVTFSPFEDGRLSQALGLEDDAAADVAGAQIGHRLGRGVKRAHVQRDRRNPALAAEADHLVQFVEGPYVGTADGDGPLREERHRKLQASYSPTPLGCASSGPRSIAQARNGPA